MNEAVPKGMVSFTYCNNKSQSYVVIFRTIICAHRVKKPVWS